MRKFTLFFMSMFLVLGTAMAKDEVQDFNSPEVYPANGSIQKIVGNIRLTFPEAIVVEQSEVSIDVLNTKTNEVVKIVDCTVNEKDPYLAVFSFEKEAVEDEKDGIVYNDKPIEAPGTYTYTIPAGLIKSADGTKEFAGGTYTFSIVSTFEVSDWSPKEATEVSEIVVTFEKEITAVNLPEAGLKCFFNYNWQSPTYILVNNANISEDKKSVTLTLDAPLTNSGSYDVDIPEGMFVSGEEVSQYKTIWFSILDTKPSFSTNYNDGDRVKELGNLEITFNNVSEFEMVDGAKIIAVLPGGDEIPGEVEKQDNKFVVSFDADFTEVGTYTFIIPAGAFTMNGEPNEARTINVELYSFELKDLEVVSVTPAVEEVDSITHIVVKFNQYVKLYYDKDGVTTSQDIYLTCGDEKYKLTNTGGAFLSDELIYSSVEWDGYNYISKPIKVPGTYTLNLEDIVVCYGADDIVEDQWYSYAEKWHVENASCKGTYSWTIKEDTSVESIPAAEGEQVIYDLLGRRVEKIAGAGIYIVNGRKMIIK